ncbi:MAG: EpsI family protein [Proteobacteria bacterium]|nr:EpsI family protein [Pseudomonadota bacterium]
MSDASSKSGWTYAGAMLSGLLLLVGILYRQTVTYLADIWSDISAGEYAHGFLVLAISLYLINYNRERLARINPCPTYLALPFVFGSVLLWLVAVLVDVEVVQALALLFVLVSVVWAMTGHQVMKVLAFPLLFIGFAIPIWFPLSPVLQEITADVVFWITRMAGIPAFRSDNLITVPGGAFSIEEACSGLRYLLAALTLGSLYAYLNYVSLAARFAVVAVVAGAALVANFLRVYIVVYLGYVTEMQHPWVADHLMLGWYLFGGLIALLLFADARLYRPGTETATSAATSVATSTVSGEDSVPCGKSQKQCMTVGAICLALLILGPAVEYQQKNQQAPEISGIDLLLPADDWLLQSTSSNDWMPIYHGSITVKKDYQVRGDDVSVVIAYYPIQKQGEEVINDLNRISNKKVWHHELSRPRTRYPVQHGVFEQLMTNSQNNKRLVWYWYNIGGQPTINKYQAKLLQLRSLLTGQPQSYMVAVSIAKKGDVETTRTALKKIVAEMEIPLASLKVIE